MVELQIFSVCIGLFLTFGILKLFRGQGSLLRYLSSLGWTGLFTVFTVLLLTLYNNIPKSGVPSLIFSLIVLVVGIYDLILTLNVTAIAMNLSRKRAFLAYLISFIPIIIVMGTLMLGQLTGFFMESFDFTQATKDYQAGHYEQALTEYDNALKAAPQKAHTTKAESDLYRKVLNGKGLTLNAQNKSQEAIEIFNQALATDANDAILYNNRGLAEFKLNDLSSASKDYDKAISLDSNNKVFYFNKGLLLVKQGNSEDAKKMFEQALKIDPNYGKALSSLNSLNHITKQ